MRYAVRDCSNRSEHPMHFTVEGPQRDFEDDRTTYVCPGGRAGDRRLRDFDGSLADLVTELERASQPVGTFETSCPEVEEYGYRVVDHIAPSVVVRRGVRHSRCFACGIYLID